MCKDLGQSQVLPYLEDYYASHGEEARLLTRHGLVEYLTTMRYIEKYVFPGARILEIGAGTGRYTVALSRLCRLVDAVEPTEANTAKLKANTAHLPNVRVHKGRAECLPFEEGLFDITLLMGPMYHIFTEAGKREALSQALRVTKGGGVVFAAYCMSDPSIVDYGFVKGNIHRLIESGMLDAETFKAYSKPSDLFELHRTSDIDRLMSGFGTERLHFVAADGCACHPGVRDALAAMDDKTFSLFLKYHFAVCEDADKAGLSHHTLDIFRKP